MEKIEENGTAEYYNPNLLKAGLIAALGGLFIYALIALLWVILTHK